MQVSLLLMWLVSVFLPGHPVLANLDNEQVNLANFAYQKAVENNISPEKFLRLMACESQLEKDIKGDWSIEQQKYLSYGILQFQPRTFKSYAKKYGFVGDNLNPYSQISLASIMIAKGEWRNWWVCGNRVGLNRGN